ncbi:MAG: radical SAM family heme chaperone HemW [Cyanobacteria bacterium J06633_8]
MTSTLPSAAYIHIPFCRRRCFYCDFPIYVVGNTIRGEKSGAISQYVEVLCQEIVTIEAEGKPLQTIFFGGGTPSLLSTQQLQRILEVLQRKFGIDKFAEISMEIDPGTFDLYHLQGYINAGVNRFSLGVQAFQEKLLQSCGRYHNVSDIFSAVDLIHQAGIANFSIDLISGLPYQTELIWQESLEQAIKIASAHISIYDLTIEAGTVFGRYYKPGDRPLPTDDTTANMYRIAHEILSGAGYEHYEISNYAKPGYQCRHNRVYWQNNSYYGFGMGAASFYEGKRFSRPRKTKEYYAWVNDGSIIDCELTTSHEALLETLMLGLRLAEGVSLQILTEQFGETKIKQVLQVVQPYLDRHWVQVVDGKFQLSIPDGFLFSNVVLAKLFEKL